MWITWWISCRYIVNSLSIFIKKADFMGFLHGEHLYPQKLSTYCEYHFIEK